MGFFFIAQKDNKKHQHDTLSFSISDYPRLLFVKVLIYVFLKNFLNKKKSFYLSVHICIILWKRIFIPIVILRIDIVANIYLNITMFLSIHPETFITSISCFPKLSSYIISNYLSIVMLVAVYAACLFKQMTSSNNKWLLIFLVMFHYNQDVR